MRYKGAFWFTLISMAFFSSLYTFVVWVGEKKRQKCFRQNLHPAYNLLKFNTLLFEKFYCLKSAHCA